MIDDSYYLLNGGLNWHAKKIARYILHYHFPIFYLWYDSNYSTCYSTTQVQAIIIT